jgi:hypothetical protein
LKSRSSSDLQYRQYRWDEEGRTGGVNGQYYEVWYVRSHSTNWAGSLKSRSPSDLQCRQYNRQAVQVVWLGRTVGQGHIRVTLHKASRLLEA